MTFNLKLLPIYENPTEDLLNKMTKYTYQRESLPLIKAWHVFGKSVYVWSKYPFYQKTLNFKINIT